jgi:hypothetical protein
MKRNHVSSTWSCRTTHWILNRISINRSFVFTSFRKSYHFQLTTIVLKTCSLLVNWDRTHIVKRWTDIIIDKWVYKIKENSDELISRFKVRWMTHDYKQIEKINYEEKYAFVMRSDTSRILLSIATILDWKIRQFDVTLAFLNEMMNRMIYIVQSKEFEISEEKDKTCLLNLDLHELMQSAYFWFQEIKIKMLAYDLIQSKHDKALFFNQKRSLYVTVYMNDIKIFVSINQMIDELSDYLKIKYKMTNLEDVKWYLRRKITCLPHKTRKIQKNQKNQSQIDQSNDESDDESNELILLI